MVIVRVVLVVIVALVGVGACGSDADVGSPGTHLQVEGVATTAVGLVQPDAGSGSGPDEVDPATSSSVPDPDDPIVIPTTPSSVPDPDDAVEVPFSGSVDCDGANSTGDGMFATTAAAVCVAIENQAASLEAVGTAHQACAQIYGGPQHVTIKGSVAGAPVDVSIDRSDGCGIDDWQRVEWLIGPPER